MADLGGGGGGGRGEGGVVTLITDKHMPHQPFPFLVGMIKFKYHNFITASSNSTRFYCAFSAILL